MLSPLDKTELDRVVRRGLNSSPTRKMDPSLKDKHSARSKREFCFPFGARKYGPYGRKSGLIDNILGCLFCYLKGFGRFSANKRLFAQWPFATYLKRWGQWFRPSKTMFLRCSSAKSTARVVGPAKSLDRSVIGDAEKSESMSRLRELAWNRD